MAAAALRTTPLDAAIFRAYRTGRQDDHGQLPQGVAKFAKALTRGLAGLCATPPAFTYERHGPPEEAQAEAEADGVSALLLHADPRYMARVSLDKPLAFALCDLLFGGIGTEKPYAEERPLSHIERDLGRHFIATLAQYLPQAFTALPQGAFTLFKPDPEAGKEPPEFKAALRISLIATIMGYSGDITIDLTESLANLGKLAEGGPSGEAVAAPASSWTPQITANLERSDVELQAVLVSYDMTLEAISALQPGQVVKLPANFAGPVTLQSDGEPIHKARLGQQARRFCLSLL